MMKKTIAIIILCMFLIGCSAISRGVVALDQKMLDGLGKVAISMAPTRYQVVINLEQDTIIKGNPRTVVRGKKWVNIIPSESINTEAAQLIASMMADERSIDTYESVSMSALTKTTFETTEEYQERMRTYKAKLFVFDLPYHYNSHYSNGKISLTQALVAGDRASPDYDADTKTFMLPCNYQLHHYTKISNWYVGQGVACTPSGHYFSYSKLKRDYDRYSWDLQPSKRMPSRIVFLNVPKESAREMYGANVLIVCNCKTTKKRHTENEYIIRVDVRAMTIYCDNTKEIYKTLYF